jgi:predicted molibdopterin-dependent oxidoreductase YjgC
MPNEAISITIDGKTVSTTSGRLLIEVAREAGYMIPSLCWHRKLSPTGACRLCIVKVTGMRGLVTSCTTAVEDGMVVTAFDDELEEERKFLVASLMTEVSMGTDGSHRDEFAEMCVRYGLADSIAPARPASEALGLPLAGEDWRSVDDSSPVLTFDPSKCIKCFRCLKGCEEVQGKGVIGVLDRGIHSYISAGIDGWGGSECDGCGECVQLCPTGALVEKPNRAAMEYSGVYSSSDKAKAVQTTCSYCGVGCQLKLTVLDGTIVRSDGVEGVLPNDGRLCVKGRFGYDYVNSPERLTVPLIKEHGAFREATWDEALDAAAAGFLAVKAKYGPDALAGYSSAKCTNEDNYLFQKFTRVAFGTNNLDYCTRLCHASTVTAMLKALGDGAATCSIEDYETVDCALVIGNNMVETHPVTATYLKRGLARGGRLVVIDPRWTPLADNADVWLQPRMGTDVALLNGMARIAISEGWIDKDFIARRVSGGLGSLEALALAVQPYDLAEVERICNVPGDKLVEATRLYATAGKSIIATGMGMSQQAVGTNNVFALINLMLVTGQAGREGAGISPPRGQNNVQGATDVGASPIFYPGYIPASDDTNRARIARLWGYPVAELPGVKGLTTVEIIKAAGDGRIHGLYVMGENPLHTDPNLNHVEHAVHSLDFMVVQDIFMTPTALKAHVVLPAASFAEKDGTFTNSDRRVLRVRKAVESPGEARGDSWIIQEIARRMKRPIGPYGSSSPYPSASSIWDEIAAARKSWRPVAVHERGGSRPAHALPGAIQHPRRPGQDHAGRLRLGRGGYRRRVPAGPQHRAHPLPVPLVDDEPPQRAAQKLRQRIVHPHAHRRCAALRPGGRSESPRPLPPR